MLLLSQRLVALLVEPAARHAVVEPAHAVVEPAARALLYCSEPAAPAVVEPAAYCAVIEPAAHAFAVVEPAACALLLLSQWLMLCCC